MNKIIVLPPSEAAKIAAGEVIERPANILKELIENAIDAGASQIVVYVEEAGKKKLRVVDNGCGMSHDDILLSTVPHATSKINSVNDLYSISTYGFRGEALASIAAVSRLAITSSDNNQHGWNVVFDFEGSISSTAVAAEQGTDVEVSDLFYNIPVRKKFLKQDETEWNQLQQLIFAFALSNLKISFKVFHNNRVTLHAPAAENLKDRIAQIWDVGSAQQFLALEEEPSQNGIRISGVITNHQTWRYGKHQIFFFVNKRLVKDIDLMKSLLKGYNNILPVGKFPAAVIMISMDPAVIDVNVHPKKEEVRFTKPYVVANTLMNVVQNTLRKQAASIFNLSDSLVKNYDNVLYSNYESTDSSEDTDVITRINVDQLIPSSDFLEKKKQQAGFKELGNVFSPSLSSLAHEPMPFSSLMSEKEKNVTSIFEGKLIGQVLNTYLIVEHISKIIFIDQHAAHERVLYEQMKDQMIARQSSMLIFPHIIAMSEQEILALERFEEIFSNFGLVYDRVGLHSLAVKSSPLGIAQIDLELLLKQAAALILSGDYLEKDMIQKTLYEHVHSHLACKKAVKAGDVLTEQEMQKLLQNLQTTEKPFICIHSRPTYWQLGQNEIEKYFQR